MLPMQLGDNERSYQILSSQIILVWGFLPRIPFTMMHAACPPNLELDQCGQAIYCNVPWEHSNWLGEMPSTIEHAQQHVDEAQAISWRFYHELSKFMEMLDSAKTAWETHSVSHPIVWEL